MYLVSLDGTNDTVFFNKCAKNITDIESLSIQLWEYLYPENPIEVFAISKNFDKVYVNGVEFHIHEVEEV